MGIFELLEIGFFMAFFNWSSPFLTVLVYSFVFIGTVLQVIFWKACRTMIMKLALVIFCVFCILVSECLWKMITGWERLVIDFIYGAVICLLLGAIIGMVILFIKSKKSDGEE